MGKDVIIITGSNGRIGSALIQRLGEKYSIVGLDKSPEVIGSEDLVLVDLSSDESVEHAFSRIQANYGTRIASVIHLAAYYSFSEKDSPLYDQITVKGTERLLNQLKNFEVEQFIFTSTLLLHAPTKPGHPIDEDSPVKATWGYPFSKVVTEKLIQRKKGAIPTVTLRVAGVYDDQCHSIPISHQIQRIYEKKLEAHLFSGNIHHGASFVHMEDLVDAIVLAVEKRKELPEETLLLIGEPKTLSYDQMQRAISRHLFDREITTIRVPKWFAKIGAWLQGLVSFKHKPFIRPWMIDYADDHYEIDISRAEKLLGWSPKNSLEKTFPVMIESLKKDPESWYKINQLHRGK